MLPDKPRLLYIIPGLIGGPALGLLRRLYFLHKRFEITVCEVVKKDGVIEQEIRKLGIPTVTIGRKRKLEISTWIKISKLIQQINPHIVHGIAFEGGLYATFLGKLYSVPAIFMNIEGMISSFTRWRLPALKVCFIVTDKVICISNAIRAKCIRYARWTSKKVHTIHNGIDLSKFNPDVVPNALKLHKKDDSFVIGNVGNFYSPIKGHKYLIKAMPMVLDAFPNAELWLVGDGVLRSQLESLTAELNLQDRVVFWGKRDDVPELLACMDIFAFPSLSEGMGMALAEAMAMGVPVVASNVGGIPEVVTDRQTGLLIPPADSEALAEALLELLNNQDLRKEFAEKGKQVISENFSLESITNQYAKLYLDTLASKLHNHSLFAYF